MSKDFLILNRDKNGKTQYYPEPVKSNKFTITLPIDYAEFREEEQLHHTEKIGIDFGDNIGDFACNIVIEKSEKGVIVRPINPIHQINVFKIKDKKNEIEIRVNET